MKNFLFLILLASFSVSSWAYRPGIYSFVESGSTNSAFELNTKIITNGQTLNGISDYVEKLTNSKVEALYQIFPTLFIFGHFALIEKNGIKSFCLVAIYADDPSERAQCLEIENRDKNSWNVFGDIAGNRVDAGILYFRESL